MVNLCHTGRVAQDTIQMYFISTITVSNNIMSAKPEEVKSKKAVKRQYRKKDIVNLANKRNTKYFKMTTVY